MVARYSFHLKFIWKAQEKSSFHFRMVVMSFIRKQEIRQHLGMLCLENSPFFSCQESFAETQKQLQTRPTAENRLPKDPDEAAACSPWGHG